MEGKTVPHSKDYLETAILRDTNAHKMYECLYIMQPHTEFPTPSLPTGHVYLRTGAAAGRQLSKHVDWLCLKTQRERKSYSFTEKNPTWTEKEKQHQESLIQVCGSFTEPHFLIPIWDLQGNLDETHLSQVKKDQKDQNFH